MLAATSPSDRRTHRRRLGAVAATLCIGTAAATTPGVARADLQPSPQGSGAVGFTSEPVAPAAHPHPLASRYDEMRPTLNYRAALAHWGMQFIPFPGSLRFHAWTFYRHVVDPVTYSVVHNAAAVAGGNALFHEAVATVARDLLAALGDFVVAELSGHSNVAPPNADSGGGADPWVDWAIEVVTAPLYYLPAPPVLIAHVPVIARFAVDVAAHAMGNLGGVIGGSITLEQALSAIDDFLWNDAVPDFISAKRALYTLPARPDPAPAAPAAPPVAPEAEPDAVTDNDLPEADETPRSTRHRKADGDQKRAEVVHDRGTLRSSPRSTPRLHAHHTPRHVAEPAGTSKAAPDSPRRTLRSR